MKTNLKSIKKRRRLIAGIILILILILFCWFLFQKRDFQVTYEKDGFQITEEYQKKENIYLFTIQKDEKEYQTILMNPHFYYEQMNIINTLNHDFFIWNYRGFYEVSDKSQKSLPLFDKDIYDAKLITKTSDYILIPNYNQEYYFNSVYLLNRKTLKYEEWNLKQNIYFDSQVLGVYKGVKKNRR